MDEIEDLIYAAPSPTAVLSAARPPRHPRFLVLPPSPPHTRSPPAQDPSSSPSAPTGSGVRVSAHQQATRRLLRNRVSAQQARERKKAYLTDLEVKVKDLEKKNSEMEEKLSTLQNESQMLRQILKNTTVSRRGPGSAASGEGQ